LEEGGSKKLRKIDKLKKEIDENKIQVKE